MKNLENYGVCEIDNASVVLIHGGSWLGEAVGKGVGLMFRYAGVHGAIQAVTDYAVYRATN